MNLAAIDRKDRDLLVLADNLLTMVVRLELFAYKPEDNERLVAYLKEQILDPELWGGALISLVESIKQEEREEKEVA